MSSPKLLRAHSNIWRCLERCPWRDFCLSAVFQVLLSWIISWLLDTRGWALTQHLDYRGCFRHREECEGAVIEWRTPPLGCTIGSQREFVKKKKKKVVSPGNLPFPPPHTHTHLFPKTLLEWQLPFLDQRKKKFYLNSEERVKRTISEQLQGNTKKKKKSSKHRNFLKIAVGDHSWRTVWGRGERWPFEDWFLRLETGEKRTGRFQDTVWRQFGIAIFSSECLSDSRKYRCQEEP